MVIEMEKLDDVVTQLNERAFVRKEYRMPRIEFYGDIVEITQTYGSGFADSGLSGSRETTMPPRFP